MVPEGYFVIILKSEAEIATMRKAGKFAAELLRYLDPFVKPGVSTLELNDLAHDYTTKHGHISAPLNYKGFTKSICTSVNEVVCHGIPHPKQRLKDGDIINIDVTPIVEGFHGDTSKMYLVGTGVSDAAKRLVKVTEECLNKGINAVKVGGRLGDIGAVIQEHAEKSGFSVVREFVGHGIGRIFHEDPQVYHFGQKGKGERIVPGMVFTIEPMINEGQWRTKTLSDGWTAITVDNKLSAQFEHTIAVHEDGTIEILTRD